MSYTPLPSIASHDVWGNPTASPAVPEAISLTSPLSTSGSQLSCPPPAGNTTTGAYTLLAADIYTSLQSTDAGAVVYTLPAGLPGGFRCRSYQKGAGTITYSAGAGATLVNTGTITSGGQDTGGFYADLENVGSDAWVITGEFA